MQLHQIKLDFDAEQDRLLMRISTSDGKEVLLWLTRRCVKLIWPLFVGMVEASVRARAMTAEARAALVGMQHEKAVKQADFSRPYDNVPRERPLGAEPLLIAKVQTKRDDSGAHILTLLPTSGPGVNLLLDERLLHSCCRLLQNAVVKADWDFKLEFPEAPPDDETAPRTLN
jgi:hypothetical protein